MDGVSMGVVYVVGLVVAIIVSLMIRSVIRTCKSRERETNPPPHGPQTTPSQANPAHPVPRARRQPRTQRASRSPTHVFQPPLSNPPPRVSPSAPPPSVLHVTHAPSTSVPPGSTRGEHNRNNGHAPSDIPRTRLSLDELASFPVNTKDKDSPCPICLGPLGDELVSTGHCLHLTHTSCLKSWLVKDRKFACPVCRVPLTEHNRGADLPVTRHPVHAGG